MTPPTWDCFVESSAFVIFLRNPDQDTNGSIFEIIIDTSKYKVILHVQVQLLGVFQRLDEDFGFIQESDSKSHFAVKKKGLLCKIITKTVLYLIVINILPLFLLINRVVDWLRFIDWWYNDFEILESNLMCK